MNVGGPAHHVALLSGGLDRLGYETLLVSGKVGPGEASDESRAERHGARLLRLDSLGPEIEPLRDAQALRDLRRIVDDFRPDIVHTHTAKAGFVGRAAARATRRPPIIVHTYHGHVLEHYFGSLRTSLYRNLERGLARVSTRLVCVSQATVDDMVRLRIAPREKLVRIPLGLDLEPFLAAPAVAGEAVRRELSLDEADVLVTCVGRLVPIKRLDIALRAVAAAREAGHPLVLAIAGDGEERPALESLARELGIADAVRFLGYRVDTPELARAADIALLTSDNEGTPVAVIEAAAAGRPTVATRAGGVAEVVAEGAGELVPRGDSAAVAAALGRLAAAGAATRNTMGERARAHVAERYSSRRLIEDVHDLYQELSAARSGQLA